MHVSLFNNKKQKRKLTKKKHCVSLYKEKNIFLKIFIFKLVKTKPKNFNTPDWDSLPRSKFKNHLKPIGSFYFFFLNLYNPKKMLFDSCYNNSYFTKKKKKENTQPHNFVLNFVSFHVFMFDHGSKKHNKSRSQFAPRDFLAYRTLIRSIFECMVFSLDLA